ncbi:MAG TPA: tetratricopeptide repeat protein [Stellaceae bacterium]|nr:tetratricopeptide repeat protein [Stellaceae bacterium]
MTGAPSLAAHGMTIPQALAYADAQRQAGRLAEAEQLCRQVLMASPGLAEAFHMLGIIAHQAGNLPAAIELVRRAIAADARPVHYHANLCEMCRVAGRPKEAIEAGRRAIEVDPRAASAHCNLGIAHYDLDDYETAAQCYRRALELDPEFAEAASNLGNAYRAQKRYDEALAWYERAIALRPGYAAAYNNMGTALRDMKRLDAAETTYRKAFALSPEDPSVLKNLALAVSDLDRKEEALTLLNRARALAPKDHQVHTYLASNLIDLHREQEAEIAGKQALALKSDDADALNVMGRVAAELERSEEALDYYRRALAIKPDLADAYNNMGNAIKELGRFDEARAAFERAIELDPRMTGAYFNLADIHKFGAEDPMLATMERMAEESETFTEEEQTQLHFALGKAYGDLGEHERSFRRLLVGNALKRRRIEYDEREVLALFDRIARVFTPPLLRAKQGMGDPSTVPVFVVGMPRSGTTLIEQILASHPKVFGAGELRHLNQAIASACGTERGGFPETVAEMSAERLRALGEAYLSSVRALAPEAPRITDKMPSNFLFVGMIRLALPNARVVHVRRDPVDTCVSCFSKLFAGEQNHTYELAELGRYYKRYEALMAHWRQILPKNFFLEVQYENVVADLEREAKRIIAHAGLEWSEQCLAFHETKRPVRTASASQVRQPIYKSAIGRWLPYKGLLTPLLSELGIESQ